MFGRARGPAAAVLCAAFTVVLGNPTLAGSSGVARAAALADAGGAAAHFAPDLARAVDDVPSAVGQPGSFTLGLGTDGWHVQTTAATTDWTNDVGATQSGQQISTPGFDTSNWLPVTADDAGAPGTEAEALLLNGICPDDESAFPTGTVNHVNQAPSGPDSIYYSNNLQDCFYGPGLPVQSRIGADTNPLFDLPWWFQTTFSSSLPAGSDAKLVVQGVVGQADVWLNGTEVATEATVEGDYTSYTFDVTNLLVPGTNTLALEVYPNNPNTMFTLDNVDWTQVPPDNNSGIQFPVSLHVSEALGLSNVYVEQDDAPDMSRAALILNADVTNNTAEPQSGTVDAVVSPPGGRGGWVAVSQDVTVPAGTTETVTFSPTDYPQLTLVRPELWWPYQMGGQPLYSLWASVRQGPVTEDATAPIDFGIRSVTTYLTAPSAEAPNGVRVFEVNGVPFVFRGGGWSENLFLHYSAADLANQIALIKSMGLNGIRTEGKQMPQDFYNQMDAAGIMIDGGFQCCDKWAPSSSGRGVTSQEYHVMYESALTIGQQLRDHPSVVNFSWSDNNPIPEQEIASEEGFSQSGFQDPIVSSAEYNTAALYGPSGEKEGPYDWVPPSYWYDTTHDSNTGIDSDNTETNVGGSFGFDSEQSAGATVPTMDSINRFLSPADQTELWDCPGGHQFHTNYEAAGSDCAGMPTSDHSGYSFGTLFNLDTAIQARYGSWASLPQYVEEAQVQNYEDTRAQFEAFIDHWDNYPTPSTGTDYWQLNKGWPTLLWDLYNYDYDQAGSYFGAKKADEELHVLYALDTGQVTVDNLSGVPQNGLSVESRVYNLSGTITDEQSTHHPITLAPQQVANGVLTPVVPAATAPPTPAQTYFVELVLRQYGTIVDRSVYWLSTQPDVIDWTTTEGNPQADNGSPLSQYANVTALQGLPTEPVNVVAATFPHGLAGTGTAGDTATFVTISNPKSNPAVAFFVRADIRKGTAAGTPLPGDNEVLPATYSDNDITLWPGQSQTIEITYRAQDLAGATPVVSVFGWNVGAGNDCGATQSCSQSPIFVAAPETFAPQTAEIAATFGSGAGYLGLADGTPLLPGSARPQTGLPAVPSTASTLLSLSETAFSPDTSPSTSFTQGDSADTYTVTVTNVGHTATDGTTPVVLTDVVGNNGIDLNYVSISGSGWSCDDSQNPTLTCTETGGSGGGPAVLDPGQSYPPLTVTVSVTSTAGYGSQNSVAGLDAINAMSVSGGAPGAAGDTIAPVTPIVGLPDLTNNYAVDGAFRQGDQSDQYQETVINQGGGATNGNAATPITAIFTPGKFETIAALYGSGWTCNLVPIASPYTEPADTCYRSDVLQGENGEEPPIAEVVSVSPNATSDTTGATEPKVVVSGGGDAVAPKSTSDSTTILAAAPLAPAANPVLTATATASGGFAQGDADDSLVLTVTNSPSNGPTAGQVTVSDTLPAGLNPQEMYGPGWACSLAPVTLPASPNTFEPRPTCSRSGSLAPGASYPPITLVVSVTDNALPSLTNSVTVSGGGMTGANTTTDQEVVTQLPYLSVSSFPSSGGIIYAPFVQGDGPGSLDDYNVTLANDGFAPTSGPVELSVTIPTGLSAYAISGPAGWSCTVATASCTTSTPVPAGTQLRFTVQVTVSSVAPTWDQALITASGGGEVATGALDLDNDYNVVENGGVFAQPTFITQTASVAMY